MNLKEFLKPDRKKIIIISIFILLSYFYVNTTIGLDIAEDYRGLPFYYLYCFYGISPPLLPEIKPELHCNLTYLNFVIDLTFWYLLSCLIVWIYDMMKNKK